MYKNCGHAIVLHKQIVYPKRTKLRMIYVDVQTRSIINDLILGTYVGWAEIHCNSSAVLLTSAASSKTVEIEQIG